MFSIESYLKLNIHVNKIHYLFIENLKTKNIIFIVIIMNVRKILTLPLDPKQRVNDLSNHLLYPFPCKSVLPNLSNLLGSLLSYSYGTSSKKKIDIIRDFMDHMKI